MTDYDKYKYRIQCPWCGEVPIVGPCPHGCDDFPEKRPEVPGTLYIISCCHCGEHRFALNNDWLCPKCAEETVE